LINKELLELRNFTQERSYKQYRKDIDSKFNKNCNKKGFSLQKRSALLLKTMCEVEEPIIFPDEKITFTRTINKIPSYYSEFDIKRTYKPRKGVAYNPLNNVCPNYKILLEQGLQGRLKIAQEGLKTAKNAKEEDFLDSVIIAINAVLSLAEKYAQKAEEENNPSYNAQA